MPYRITSAMFSEHWGRVTGSEHELGVLAPDGSADFSEALLPPLEFVSSGARIYSDVQHPEMCTGEASNPLQLVALERGLERRMLSLGLGVDLYKNSSDFGHGDGSIATFGAHENYFTHVPRAELDLIIPFLVSRVIFTGSGSTAEDSEFLHLSQRASHIERLRGDFSTCWRPLLNERDEPLSDVPGWYRLHLIGSDANMSPWAILLKHGSLMLLLPLLERGELDALPYNDELGIVDLRNISANATGWEMAGVKGYPRSAIDVQRFFLNQVVSKTPSPTPLQRVVMHLWRDVLFALDTDPNEAVGLVDWVTKQFILDALDPTSAGSVSKELRQSTDLEYHQIDPERSLFFGFEESYPSMRLLREDTIAYFESNPPSTTRAWARGNAARIANSQSSDGEQGTQVTPDWDSVKVRIDGAHRPDLSLRLADPRHPYSKKVEALLKELRA